METRRERDGERERRDTPEELKGFPVGGAQECAQQVIANYVRNAIRALPHSIRDTITKP